MAIIVDFLNAEFYYSAVDNCVFCNSNENQRIGYQQIENIVIKNFETNDYKYLRR